MVCVTGSSNRFSRFSVTALPLKLLLPASIRALKEGGTNMLKSKEHGMLELLNLPPKYSFYSSNLQMQNV
jgi:hypothetical protein